MKVLKIFLEKYKNMSKPIKASIWFIICYVIQRGFQFIGMPIFTRLMSTEEYGIYSVFLSWFNIICIFTSLNIYAGTFNKAMIKYSDSRDEYISTIQILTTITTIVFGIFILFFQSSIVKITEYDLKFIIVLIIYLLVFPTYQYWCQKQRFEFEYRKMVLLTLLSSISTLLLGIVFVALSHNKSFALVSTTVGVQVLISIFLYISILKKSNNKLYNKKMWMWTLGMAIPLLPHYLSEIILGHSDRIMIKYMIGNEAAAIYNIVYQISMLMTIIRTGINGAFAPWLYNSIKEKKYKEIKKVSRFLTFLMFGMSFLLILIGPEILKIAAPNQYYEAVIDIPAIMASCYLMFIYILFTYVEIYYEKNKYASTASLLAALINVGLNIIFINKYGYLAAGYTTLASYFIMVILHFIFMKIISKNNQEVKEMFDYKELIISCLIMFLVIIVSMILYDYIFIRYIIIIGIILIMLIKKDLIIKNMKLIVNKE